MTALRFLLLEDNPLDAEVIHLTLTDGGVECELLRVETRTDFVRALETNAFDLILADYTLPGFDGISALGIAQNLCPDTPFIFVSGSMGEELAIEVEVGALYVVVKHAFTHFKITLHAFECRYVSGDPQKRGVHDFAWVTESQLESYSFGKADREVIAALRSRPGMLF